MNEVLGTAVSDGSQLGLLFLGALCGALLVVLLFAILYWRKSANKPKQAELIKAQIFSEDMSTEAIFADLELGVLAFGPDQKLKLSNKAVTELLGEKLPQDLDGFLTHYGEENGLKARMILAKGPASAQFSAGDKVLRITVNQSRTESLQNAGNIVILQDITDQELQEKQRKDFVANVSHELKTPLTTITTYSESLLDWGLDEKHKDGIRKDLLRIHDDAIRMEGLVTDLLLLSSIDSRKMQNRMEPQDLTLLVKQTVDRMQVQAKEKQIRMSFTQMAAIPSIFGDRSSLERVVSNLLSNAIKYTDKKGTIKVYVGRVMDSVYVKVTDNGNGIEEKHVSQIFNRFYRVDMTGSRIYGGTGLGLAIAQELVLMHQGQISVQSALGQGSSFTVMLPSAAKIYNDTLTDIASGVVLRDEIRIAAAKELVSQINEQGGSIDSLNELKAEQLADMIAEYSRESEVSSAQAYDRFTRTNTAAQAKVAGDIIKKNKGEA